MNVINVTSQVTKIRSLGFGEEKNTISLPSLIFDFYCAEIMNPEKVNLEKSLNSSLPQNESPAEGGKKFRKYFGKI